MINQPIGMRYIFYESQKEHLFYKQRDYAYTLQSNELIIKYIKNNNLILRLKMHK